ncbi:MAG: ABC transporter permease [Ahrensia sp.]
MSAIGALLRELGSLVRQRTLIVSFARRNLRVKYMSSVLGMTWIVATPLALLLVYSFVFGFILKPRWQVLEDKDVAYVLFLFSGLTVFWIFSEIVYNAPGVLRSQSALVKKVKFPIQILPVVMNVTALASWIVNFGLLMAAMVVFQQAVSWTALLVPFALVPVVLFSLGMAWLLAALGTYFRDVAQAAGVIGLAALFMSAIFFPLTAVPEAVRPILMLNPIAVSVETMRDVLLYRELPSVGMYATGIIIGTLTMFGGLGVFMKVRRGFADVL